MKNLIILLAAILHTQLVFGEKELYIDPDMQALIEK